MRWCHIKTSIDKEDKSVILWVLRTENQYIEQKLLVNVDNRDGDDSSESRDEGEMYFVNVSYRCFALSAALGLLSMRRRRIVLSTPTAT